MRLNRVIDFVDYQNNLNQNILFHIWNNRDSIVDINNWLIFAKVVDLGGISNASRRLGVPKSTLSRRLTKLEEQLGFRLLHRSGRSFTLTDAGRLFYQESLSLTEQVNQANLRLNEVTQPQSGVVRMTAPKAPGGTFLGVWLAKFMRLYPLIHIELDLTDTKINLFEHNYDLALRVGPLADSSLIARKVGVSERLLVASPRYLAINGLPKKPSELKSLSCIGFSEQSSGQGTWQLHGKNQRQSIRFYPTLRNDDMATTLCLAQADAGIAMIPAFMCNKPLQEKTLQRVLTQWSGPLAEFYLIYQQRELLPSRVRLLIDFLLEQGQKEAWRLSIEGESSAS